MAYSLCLTTIAEAYDIAVHAGWDYARGFKWNRIDADEEAMQALIERGKEACHAAGRAKYERCYREALANQLGLPKEDAAACATAGDRPKVEACLRTAHDYRFLEAAASRVHPGEG